MTGSKVDTSRLDARRRRLVFRAWHRGIREMDLVLGQYVDAHIENMDDKTLNELEEIMSYEDRDMLTWVTGEIPIPQNVDTPLFRDILNYRARKDYSV